MTYPMLVNLQGRRCAVIGGGKTAARKILEVLRAGAFITVVSQEVEETLVALEADGKLDIVRSMYSSGVLAQIRPVLVFAATNSPAVNHQVILDARALNVLVMNAHDEAQSDFQTMTPVQRGLLTIAFSAPDTPQPFTHFMRHHLEKVVGAEYGTYVDLLLEVRQIAQEQPEAIRVKLWKTILESQVLELLALHQEEKARKLVDDLVSKVLQGM